MSFYAQQRLQHQLGMVEQSYGDREACELWAKLQVKQRFLLPFIFIQNKKYSYNKKNNRLQITLLLGDSVIKISDTMLMINNVKLASLLTNFCPYILLVSLCSARSTPDRALVL